MGHNKEVGRLRRTDTAYFPTLHLDIQEIVIPLVENDPDQVVNVRILSFSNPPSLIPGKDIPVIVKIVKRQHPATEIDTYYLDGHGFLLAHVGSMEVDGKEPQIGDLKIDRDFSKLREYRDTIAGSPSLNTSALMRMDEILDNPAVI